MELQFHSLLSSALVESRSGRLSPGIKLLEPVGLENEWATGQTGRYGEENKLFSFWESNHDIPVIRPVTWSFCRLYTITPAASKWWQL
jgi:hypothetical protein